MKRVALLAGVAGLTLAGPAAAAGDEPLLTLCIERTPRDLAAAAVLDGWMNAVRIELAAPPCAAPPAGHFVGRFEMRGALVYFRLAGASGPALGRALPWLDGVDQPLASLDGAGWLGEFSVVLEALLAEHHLALEWAEILEAELGQAGTGDVASGAQGVRGGKVAGESRGAGVGKSPGKGTRGVKRAGKGSGRAKSAGGGRSAGKPGDPGGGTKAGGARMGASANRADGAPAGLAAGAGASQAPGAAGAGDANLETTSAGSGDAAPGTADGGATGAPGLTGPSDPAIVAGVPGTEGSPSPDDARASGAEEIDPPRLPGIEEEARATAARIAAAAEAERNRIDFRAPDPDPISLGLLAGGALRLRSPDIAAPEVSLSFEVGSFYARGAWQPRVRWHLADLPIGVEALGAEVGLHFPLLSGRIWSIRGHAGAAVERLVLTPLYRADASEQGAWDAGPTTGATLGWRVASDVEVGIAGGVHWMPTARLTHVGSLGPSARVNAFGGRLGVDFSWRR